MEINVEDNIHKLRLRLIDSVIYQMGDVEMRNENFRNLIINVEVRMNILNERVGGFFILD